MGASAPVASAASNNTLGEGVQDVKDVNDKTAETNTRKAKAKMNELDQGAAIEEFKAHANTLRKAQDTLEKSIDR